MLSSKRRRSALHAVAQAAGSAGCAASALDSAGVGLFFVNTADGRIATRNQLAEAGIVGESEQPELPWHRIQGPSDASTLWYALMRKRERGIFIGSMCIRHSPRQASLEERGWEEVPVERIGPDAAGAA
jgi:hypothetical protein